MRKAILGLFAGVLSIIGIGASANNSGLIKTDGNANYSDSKVVQKSEPVIETKVVQETVTVPFETITREDATLAKGTTRVETEGANGERVDSYEVEYRDGTEISRKIISSKVTKAAVNKVVVVGTYVAPTATMSNYCENGTYVNSAGNTVCRPSAHNTGGATAICNDGTYSYSQSRRGTCSHHGGVKSWL